MAWYGAIAFGVLVVLETGFSLLADPAGARIDLRVPFDLAPAAFTAEAATLGVEGVLVKEASGTFHFRSTNVALLATWLGALALWLTAGLVVIHHLRRLFQTLAAGAPFAPANASRIRAIGLVVLALELCYRLLVLLQSLFLRHHFETSGLVFRVEFRPSLTLVFLGLVLLVISEIFRLGTALERDQALTV